MDLHNVVVRNEDELKINKKYLRVLKEAMK